MTFTIKELAAIYKVSVGLMAIDGDIAQSEVQVLYNEFMLFDINEQAMKTIVDFGQQISNEECFSTIRNFDDEQKQYLSDLLERIVLADGKLGENESETFWDLLSTCELPDPSDMAQEEADNEADKNVSNDDDAIAPAFIVAYTTGIVEFKQTEDENWSNIGPEIASWIRAESVDVVRFTKPLNALSQQLGLKGKHLIFMLPRRSNSTLGDNMTGTLLYGAGYEIMGHIVFALETDKGYEIEGFHSRELIINAASAINNAVGGLLRMK